MKGKFKKVLAGIAMGLVGAVALTGCSLTGSDLNINQGELDKLIGGVNQFIEVQNTKQSAKEKLEYLLMQSKFANEISKGYQMNTSMVAIDKYGIENGFDVSQKIFMDEETETFKFWGKWNGNDIGEVELYDKAVSVEEGGYEKTRYNLTDKTYAQVDEFESLGYGSYVPMERVINSLLTCINNNSETCKTTEIFMKNLSDNKIQFDFMFWMEYTETNGGSGEDNVIYSEVYSLIFENDKLASYNMTYCYDVGNGNSISKYLNKIDFTYNTGDFEIDTSDFTLVEADELI